VRRLDLAPIFKFEKSSGKATSFGMIVFPHGLYVDKDGNVSPWDGQANKQGTKGQQVFKFSPSSKVLLTLGKAGVSDRTRCSTSPRRDHRAERRHFCKSTATTAAG
jgi:hypothetical protein